MDCPANCEKSKTTSQRSARDIHCTVYHNQPKINRNHYRHLLRGTYQSVRGDGSLEKPGIRGDDLEVELSFKLGAPGKEEREGARDRGVEETQAVFPGLHVEERPRLSVDVNNITPKTVALPGGREQSPVAVVLLGRDDQRDVEFAVARREVQCAFGRVLDDVCAGLPEIRILGGLDMEWLAWPLNSQAFFLSSPAPPPPVPLKPPAARLTMPMAWS